MQTVNMASLFKLQAKTTFNPQLSVGSPSNMASELVGPTKNTKKHSDK
jgi:hypothetical protein